MPVISLSRALSIRLLYIAHTLSVVPWSRFHGLYFQSRGLSSTTIGSLAFVASIAKVLGYPLGGLLADKRGIRLALSISFLCGLGTLWALSLDFIYTLPIICLAFLRGLRSLTNFHLPLIDTFALSNADSGSYGSFRVFASISWGLGSLITGWIVDQMGIPVVFPLSYLLLGFYFLCVCLFLPTSNDSFQSYPKTLEGSSGSGSGNEIFGLIRDLGAFAIAPSTRSLLMIMLLYGFVMSVPDSLLMLHMNKNLQIPSVEIGLSVAISVLLEIPLMLKTDEYIRTYGYRTLILTALAATTLRLLGYSLFSSEPGHLARLSIPVIQSLHGISFTFFWICFVKLGWKLSPSQLKASSQSILSLCYGTLGHGIGSIVFGYVLDHYGPSTMFIIASICGFIVFAITSQFLGRDEVASIHHEDSMKIIQV